MLYLFPKRLLASNGVIICKLSRIIVVSECYFVFAYYAIFSSLMFDVVGRAGRKGTVGLSW